ncbi:hypothetical protein FACS1894211_00820 [Clostridia bacterium]|nr:hypothetical protein FACS1894211_00820 [Clostridia bacterium]
MQTAYAEARESAGNGIFRDKARLRDLYGFISRNNGLTFYQCVEVLNKNPNATRVMTFDEWHETTDRRIKRGSKAIAVLDARYPNRKKYFFDVSQTYGFREYKQGESITDLQLLDAVKSQCVWTHDASGTYRDRLYSAVADFCDNHDSGPGGESFMQAVTDGVFTCAVNRYNRPSEYIRYEDYPELNERDAVAAGITAARIADLLFTKITEYRSKRNERNEERRRIQANGQAEKATEREQKATAPEQGKQQTLFDAFDPVRDFDAGLFSGVRTGAIPAFDPVGKIIPFSPASAEGRGDDEGAADAGAARLEPVAGAAGAVVLGEGAVREPNRAADTRDDPDGNRLPNYRLTEANFENLGGAKTRYRNNVAAIKLIRELESANAVAATEEQRDVLARYVGWGGIPQAFDDRNADWKKEYTELKELLRGTEYEKARTSTLNAHYTSKTVIDAIYTGLARMGLTDGIMLEPAVGTGNFLGLMPDTFKGKVYGVELDSLTGKIAKYLYPNADIQIKGFEETDFPNNYFDGAATNVPFGAYSVHDPVYNKYKLYIHDYFILKTLDQLREGGVAAIVTSKGTLDKANANVRKLFAERARLLGAIRLPNNAFKNTAGTEVTTDILFFRKGAAAEQNADWLEIGADANGIPVNGYYLSHPEMVLGTMRKGAIMYGNADETYCEADGRNLSEALSEAVKNLPENVYAPRVRTRAAERSQDEPIPAFLNVKNYCYAVKDDKIYMRVDNEMIPQNVPQAQEWRLKGLIGLRQQTRNLLNVQIENCPDEILLREQEKLNAMYDRFVRQYGCLNTRTNRNLFREDADYTLLISLENYDEAAGTAKKTDIFSKRTIRKYTRPTRADTALEALQISKNETGRVDLRIIEELTGKTHGEVVAELDGYIYRNPEAVREDGDRYAGWEAAAEYLSGNVRRKLDFVKAYAAANPEFTKNIAALERVQPPPLGASEISVRMGMGWIPVKIYKQFLFEKFKIKNSWLREQTNLTFNPYTQSWKLEVGNQTRRSFEATNIYGTGRMNGCAVFEHAINLQTPTIYDTVVENGTERRVVNKSETIAARECLRKIQEEFKAWVFDDPKRREELVRIYNEKYNNLVLANYDGGYLTFPEMNPLIELKDYQKDAVERIITAGNTLLHHVVGAGKTFEIAAAAMKLRQLKLANKPMIIVPNHLVLQWANEFRTLYPQANLLIATKKDFEKENRLKFVSRIATGDWDAVIMAQSSFEKIPISQERRQRLVQEEISNIRQRLDELRGEADSRMTIKIMEKVLKNKEADLKELLESKKDDLIRFEDLGVDCLFVDEAHKYKNKFVFTKMTNVSGISQAASKRASDLDMKIDYLSELHKGQKGVVFATGTPISNSMVEMYTMQSYLQRRDLAEAGLLIFDNWAANFGETVSALELAPSGQGYRSKTRFAKFCNLPELLKMYRKFADVRTADMLNLPVPKANRHVVTIKPTDTVLELCEVIAERAERINNRQVSPEVDNMLKVCGDGRKLALDPRCFDRAAPDDPEYKINVAAENIYRIWRDTADTRGTQLVFCDLSTPKIAFEDYNPETDFDAYNHVKRNLVQMGIPANEIAYIHEAENDVAKQTLFDNVRSGKIRVLIGSTEKCGAGTNVQNKLVALHHLDTPFRPSDLEQREGRAIRQGNKNAEVDIYTYVTKRTFDSYMYQILENKQRFIAQINNGELTVREAADIDETTLTYAEIKAITSGNPLIKRKQEAEAELGNLQILERQYRNNRYALQDKIAKEFPQDVERISRRIGEYERDIALRDENKTETFVMTIAGKQYTERKDAAELLHGLICSPVNANKAVAVYKGFEIIPEPMTALDAQRTTTLRGNGDHRVTVSESATGTLTRLDNFFDGLEGGLRALNEKRESYSAEIVTAQAELDKPFEHAQRLTDLTLELEKINAELNLDKRETELVIDDTKFQNEVKTETGDEDENGDGDDERRCPVPALQRENAQHNYELG